MCPNPRCEAIPSSRICKVAKLLLHFMDEESNTHSKRPHILPNETQFVMETGDGGSELRPNQSHASNHHVCFLPRADIALHGPPTEGCPSGFHRFSPMFQRISYLARFPFGFYTFCSCGNSSTRTLYEGCKDDTDCKHRVTGLLFTATQTSTWIHPDLSVSRQENPVNQEE